MASTPRAGHIGISVTDLTVSSAFYREALGFELVAEDPARGHCFLGSGDQVVLTLWQQADQPFTRERAGLHHLPSRSTRSPTWWQRRAGSRPSGRGSSTTASSRTPRAPSPAASSSSTRTEPDSRSTPPPASRPRRRTARRPPAGSSDGRPDGDATLARPARQRTGCGGTLGWTRRRRAQGGPSPTFAAAGPSATPAGRRDGTVSAKGGRHPAHEKPCE